MTTDTNKDADLYSVWVGGGEINDYYLTREAAERVAKAWRDYGYPEATIRQEACDCGDCSDTPLEQRPQPIEKEKGEDNK
jgi:hypothetical protein